MRIPPKDTLPPNNRARAAECIGFVCTSLRQPPPPRGKLSRCGVAAWLHRWCYRFRTVVEISPGCVSHLFPAGRRRLVRGEIAGVFRRSSRKRDSSRALSTRRHVCVCARACARFYDRTRGTITSCNVRGNSSLTVTRINAIRERSANTLRIG